MKHLLLKSWLMLACMLFASMGASATDVVFDFTSLETTSGTQDGISWETGKTGSASATACNSTNGLVLYGVSGGGGYFNTTSATSGTITKVVLSTSAKKNTPKYTAYGSTNGTDWTEIESNIGAGTKTINISGSYTYFKIQNTTNATAQLAVSTITISYTSGGGSTPEPTKYNVIVANNIANGTVTANPTSAAAGATVALTATPASGYEFTSWNVTNASTSAPIKVTNNQFTMPGANVNVSATFSQVQSIDLGTGITTLNTFSSFSGTGYKSVSNYTISGKRGFNVTDCMLSSSELQMKANSGKLVSPIINSTNGFDVKVTFSKNGSGFLVKIGDEDAVTSEGSTVTASTSSTSTTFTISAGSNYGIISKIELLPHVNITLNAACTDGADVYGTYSNTSAWVVPAELTVSEVGLDGEGKLVVGSYATGDVVPANTGVMVSATEGGDYTVALSNAAGTHPAGVNNALHPSSEAMTGDNLFYRLTMHNGTTIGFAWGAADGAAFSLGANKAYLAVPKSAGVKSLMWTDNNETAIQSVEAKAENKAVFNLAGQRVNKAMKGIYIVNGKKVVK